MAIASEGNSADFVGCAADDIMDMVLVRSGRSSATSQPKFVHLHQGGPDPFNVVDGNAPWFSDAAMSPALSGFAASLVSALEDRQRQERVFAAAQGLESLFAAEADGRVGLA